MRRAPLARSCAGMRVADRDRDLRAAESGRAGTRSHRSVRDHDVGDTRSHRRRGMHQHAHRTAATVRNARRVTDLLESDRAHELGFFHGVDRVAHETVDVRRLDLRVRARRNDRLARELQLAARRVARELGLAHPRDRGRLARQHVGARHDARKTGTVPPPSVGSNSTIRRIPMRMSAGSIPTRFVTTRTPPSRSTNAASTGYSNNGLRGWWSTA